MRIVSTLASRLCIVMVVLVVCGCSMAGEPLRGLVVDRTDNILWLGLPGPVQAGAVFDVMLVPGDKVIARAEVIECTPDAPYVARARFAMEDPSAFIPVGAYVEAVSEVIADRDRPCGYKAVRVGPRKPNPLQLQAGLFFPTKGDLGDETSDTWPAFQLSYRVAASECSETSIGVGYLHGDGDFTIGGIAGRRDFRVFPVTLDVKTRGARSADKRWFVRVSLGAYLIDDERTLGGVTSSESDTAFGWQVGFGYESRSGRSAQIHYVDVSKTDFRGVVFTLGARF
ncbi:MAG TPA: hypothetical protein VMX94_13305 [Armatimonadota bacterium]|nr:hypothetical protein [Armatimonadota bacterium]